MTEQPDAKVMEEAARWGIVVDVQDGLDVLAELLNGRTREDGPDPDSVGSLIKILSWKLNEALGIDT